MRLIVTTVVVLAVAVGAIVGLAYSGLPDVSATASESSPVRWLLETTRKRAVESRAAGIEVPDVSGQERLAAGAAAFDDMCVGCHGAPGREPFVGARYMSPPPPDLARPSPERSAAETYWVIKHGIRMTGMPAWGPTHSESDLWDLTAVVERLPQMSAEEFADLLAGAGGHGHGHAH